MKTYKQIQNQLVRKLCKKEKGRAQINAGQAREIIKMFATNCNNEMAELYLMWSLKTLKSGGIK